MYLRRFFLEKLLNRFLGERGVAGRGVAGEWAAGWPVDEGCAHRDMNLFLLLSFTSASLMHVTVILYFYGSVANLAGSLSIYSSRFFGQQSSLRLRTLEACGRTDSFEEIEAHRRLSQRCRWSCVGIGDTLRLVLGVGCRL